MKAAIELMEQLKADVAECLTIIELTDLNGQAQITKPFYSFIQY